MAKRDCNLTNVLMYRRATTYTEMHSLQFNASISDERLQLEQVRLLHDPNKILLANFSIAVSIRFIYHLLQLLVGYVFAELLSMSIGAMPFH